jgi:tRNA(His) 5'-end guanylyltransferase
MGWDAVISVLLTPQWELFHRSVEKLVSISAGVTSAAFTHACGEPAHFDSRIWLGTSVNDVVDYFSWRQTDATRCALNGWCYWTLRAEQKPATEVAALLHGMGSGEKNELLLQRGINFDDLPAWQRRGIGIRWETYTKNGLNPLSGQTVPTRRRRLRVDRDLPIRETFRQLVSDLAP